MNKRLKKSVLLLLAGNLCLLPELSAQEKLNLTLEEAIEAARKNNQLLQIRKLQVSEKDAKVKESQIRLYPSVSVNAGYQYNTAIGELAVPAGSFGELPLYYPNTGIVNVAMPNEGKTFDVSRHNNLNAGVLAYQPLTQLAKIKTGVEVSKTDAEIARAEQRKTESQIVNAVEQYYYGILSVQKRKLEAQKKIELAKLKLYDVQSALLAGKTTDLSELGLNAEIANEEQELLKLKFQEEDYLAELKTWTGIRDSELVLTDTGFSGPVMAILDDYQTAALKHNADLKIAELQKQKAGLAVKAARRNYTPDFGVFAGYAYQEGNRILPKSNPYAGLSFKWNIQDLLTNRQSVAQYQLLREQAGAHEEYLREQTMVSIEKAYRKMKQAEELIAVARKAVGYRKAEWKVRQDRRDAGLAKPIELLEAEAALAKSEADLYGAIMSLKLAQAELKMLTEE